MSGYKNNKSIHLIGDEPLSKNELEADKIKPVKKIFNIGRMLKRQLKIILNVRLPWRRLWHAG